MSDDKTTDASERPRLIHSIKSGDDTPPRRTPRREAKTPGKSGTTASAKPSMSSDAIGRGMTELYSGIGALTGMLVDPMIGQAFTQNADRAGAAWAKVCQDNETMKRIASGLLQGSNWGELFAAHLPIGLAIRGAMVQRRANREAEDAPVQENVG